MSRFRPAVVGIVVSALLAAQPAGAASRKPQMEMLKPISVDFALEGASTSLFDPTQFVTEVLDARSFDPAFKDKGGLVPNEVRREQVKAADAETGGPLVGYAFQADTADARGGRLARVTSASPLSFAGERALTEVVGQALGRGFMRAGFGERSNLPPTDDTVARIARFWLWNEEDDLYLPGRSSFFCEAVIEFEGGPLDASRVRAEVTLRGGNPRAERAWTKTGTRCLEALADEVESAVRQSVLIWAAAPATSTISVDDLVELLVEQGVITETQVEALKEKAAGDAPR